MRDLQSKVAVITGAASGIGRGLANHLRREGCALALSDTDGPGLEQVVAALPPGEGRVTTSVVDVADRDAVHRHADEVYAAHGAAHVVINNAGVGQSDVVSELTYEDLEWVMAINFWGVVHGTKAFLPRLLDQGEGHIVNISSVFGLIGVPSQAAYCASKFAVRGFTESMRQELQGTGVVVSCVHPGGVKTNIVRNARSRRGPDGKMVTAADAERYEKFFRTTAEQAAQIIVNGIKRDRPRILVGSDATFLDSVQRLLPRRYTGVIARLLGAS